MFTDLGVVPQFLDPFPTFDCRVSRTVLICMGEDVWGRTRGEVGSGGRDLRTRPSGGTIATSEKNTLHLCVSYSKIFVTRTRVLASHSLRDPGGVEDLGRRPSTPVSLVVTSDVPETRPQL